MDQKNLQTIQKEKLEMPKQEPVQNTQQELANNKYPPNYIVNIVQALKDAKGLERIWFDYELPSMGLCGYPKDIKLRELTTEDERIFLKEMFNSKESSLFNLIKKCAKFEGNETFDFQKLTTFDQDFILLELSAITFPGEKDIIFSDENGHKIEMKLNKEELELNKIIDDIKYPFEVELPNSGIKWYLDFMTIEKSKEIDNTSKLIGAGNDLLLSSFASISHCTAKVIKDQVEILVDSKRDYIQILKILKPTDLRILINKYNEISIKYGYKLVKEFFCKDCGKINKIELDPLSFFRLTI